MALIHNRVLLIEASTFQLVVLQDPTHPVKGLVLFCDIIFKKLHQLNQSLHLRKCLTVHSSAETASYKSVSTRNLHSYVIVFA